MDWSNPWVVGPLCTGLGVLVGMFIMRWLGGESQSAQQAAEELREEFSQYRDSVGQHFATTSELFQDMTEKYRDVYNHMASGAQEFGGKDDAGPRLEIVGDATRLSSAAAANDASGEVPDSAAGDIAEKGPAEDTQTTSDDVATARTDGDTPAAPDDAAVASSEENAPKSEDAHADSLAADDPVPPIDYDAQPLEDTQEIETVVAAPEQAVVTPPPAAPSARGPSRWGLKQDKPDADDV